MRVCFFGTYTRSQGYPVNRVLIKGLSQAGADVIECREELWGPFLYRALAGHLPRRLAGLAIRLPWCYLRLAWRYWRMPAHDWVVVGYAGHLDVHFARLLNLFRRRRVALVSFISLYDTAVLDRAQVTDRSLRGRLLWHADRWAFGAAHLVLADTEAVCAHYSALFRIPSDRFVRSYVGEDGDEFPFSRPPSTPGPLRVLFFGTYVPLHGIDVIIEAAAITRETSAMAYTLIGSGQLYPELREQANRRGVDNVEFIEEWVDTAALVEHITSADVCLGIFGTTPKAARVVPYKVFDALAVGRPVITRDSPAARELLTHGESALLCEPGSGQALASDLCRLEGDAPLRKRLAEGGHAEYLRRGSPRAIGAELLPRLQGAIHD